MLHPDTMEDLLEEAHRTLRRLPWAGPKKKQTFWPEVVHDRAETYGWQSATIALGPPSGERIDRLDALLECSLTLSEASRIAIWGRAARATWRSVAAAVGEPPKTVKKRHSKAIADMILAWEQMDKKPRIRG